LSHLGWLDINKQPLTADKLKEIVTYQRGSDDRSKNLHIKIEIPETYNYTLGDCFIGGASLDWVCQVIDSSVTVLTGIAINGHDPDCPFLFSKAEMDATSVPCKNLWGTRAPDGKGALGPVQDIITPIVETPKAPSMGDEG
jgi:hypothetical protein